VPALLQGLSRCQACGGDSVSGQVQRSPVSGAEFVAVWATVQPFAVLADAISSVENFIHVFILVYILIIFGYILTSWIRLPYSPWVNRIQRFLYDVCEPYLRLFRRILPPIGPLDLSPMIGIIALFVIDRLVVAILDQLR
jgi:YggT family protein